MYSLLLAIIYLTFISLGIPDPLLGSAWPSMYPELGVPVSYSGIISMTISVNTIISSLNGDRLTRRFGTAKVTAMSVAMTAVAIFGFSFSSQFWQLFLWAIPYGLGAGSVDAAMNNYVALHYESKHMSWLHCMWGVGTILGTYIIGYALTGGHGWNMGYRIIGVMQVILTAIIFISIPLWKKNPNAADAEKSKPVTLREAFRIRGAKEVMIVFLCYCAVEQTTMLWASSYMVLHNGISADLAASYASMFYIGITLGRAANGFFMMKFNDTQMIRVGQVLICVGVLSMLFSLSNAMTLVGLILIGLGCAPIYPCIIHSTPAHFGADKSQALIGIQMACAYVGTSLMPPLFGVLQSYVGIAVLPIYLLVFLGIMILMHEQLVKKTAAH